MNTEQEIIIMWALTAGSVVIMLFRLFMKADKRRRLDLGDYFTIAAIVSLLLRSAVENVPMVWGDNQISKSDREGHTFTSEELYRHGVGAKLTMVNRVFYTVYVWLQKCVVMCIVQQLLRGINSRTSKVLYGYWAILGITFAICIVFCFTECQPFQLYWQVVPDPGKCGAGNLQLLVFSVLEMFTDVMLMILPLRYLSKINRPWLARLRLICLFLVGLAIVAVTMTRLIMNRTKYHRSGASHNIANVELLFAAFVANAPPIYGLINTRIVNSSQRSRSAHNNGSSTNHSGGRQLDTLNSISGGGKQSKTPFGQWTNVSVSRKNGETDSDEELIIDQTPRPALSSTSSNRLSQST